MGVRHEYHISRILIGPLRSWMTVQTVCHSIFNLIRLQLTVIILTTMDENWAFDLRVPISKFRRESKLYTLNFNSICIWNKGGEIRCEGCAETFDRTSSICHVTQQTLKWCFQNANFWKNPNNSREISIGQARRCIGLLVSVRNWIRSITNRCLVRDRLGRGPRQQGADLPHNPSLTPFINICLWIFNLTYVRFKVANP